MREKLSQLNTKLNESISSMRIIQQFRQEARLAKEFEQVNNEYLDTALCDDQNEFDSVKSDHQFSMHWRLRWR